ncbi:HK97 family phage prohead protease [Colletotrichum graminicola M1.001]|uniref:HK97 family phage prohead protease n=1 Tax=Colletotrichum graminicola (strain M1.001 / M2 / FGSC 10212) TaxID=645133 RepID=E3QUR7_COLGM|nr:HK97 family phage prohead protease [Colletotrichum graminicola M1.001]EFQ34605.1 HK97 family phage prohead protease [Colletotrichum graminicola M1.001]
MTLSKQQKKIATDLTEYASRHRTTGPYADNLDVDVLIVGGGFGGVFMLKTLREMGLRAIIYEAGTNLGGTWRWNRYPGARVDSEVPEYEFSWPEAFKDWIWSTNYPDFQELRAYFDHVDKVLSISKDCSFETVVVGAQFQPDEGKWHIKTADGRLAKSKYFVVAAGFASKRYIPNWPGIESFRGIVHHSSFWPEEKVDVRGKRCAVIGTGASGVQIAQEWGQAVGQHGELKVFQRTPNLALPMGKRPLTPQEQNNGKSWYPRLFHLREKCFGGFVYGMIERGTFDDTPEEREAFYRSLWDRGGFRYWLGNYKDMLSNADANKKAYDFWSRNVRARIGDARKRDILAPTVDKMPHFFGVKRPCLEQNYYEQFNKSNVDVIDVSKNEISSFSETGIELKDGTHYEFDVVAIATGFDITTGGMTNMGLRSINNTNLQDEWKAAANTYLGTTISGYPNMFHLYGPHGPTLLSNGPTTVEVQGRWIADCIRKIEREHIKYINPTAEATKAWKQRINALSDATLFPTTRSTYMGGSVPGKAFEQVNFSGGVPQYADEIREKLDNWSGFDVVKDTRGRSRI